MTTLRDVACIGVDADDTLWHSENRFRAVHARFCEMLGQHVELSAEELDAAILATERQNLAVFGYGAKAFTLSLIETAIEVTDGAVPASAIATILAFGKELLAHPVELLPGVAAALAALRSSGRMLVLVTKGDLLHQESKIAGSGVGDLFDAIEIVSEKDERTYQAILDRHGVSPERFCMVGNSVRSDVLPVLAIGGRAVHIPYEHEWAHEVVDGPIPEVVTASSLAEFVTLLG